MTQLWGQHRPVGRYRWGPAVGWGVEGGGGVICEGPAALGWTAELEPTAPQAWNKVLSTQARSFYLAEILGGRNEHLSFADRKVKFRSCK